MKRTLLLLAFISLTLPLTLPAQVASNCTVPAILNQEYRRDFVNLSMTAMVAAQSADTAYVHVPATWLDPIAGGIAAIFNATSIPERDSVFDLYCVHDATSPIQTYSGYLIEVDTTYSWTQAWQNMTTLTGNAPLDSLLLNYDLQITQYFNWSFGQYALLNTDSLWNNRALIDSLEMIPGIIYGEPDAIIGAAGRIEHHTSGGDRYYDFYFEFNDCFDGCDNYRVWHFRVTPDCQVFYLGFDDWGFFGVEPLPAPLNCNISTAITETQADDYRVFPNPASTRLTIQSPEPSIHPATAELYDLTGRKVLATGEFETETTLNLTTLPAAMYTLLILQDGHIMDIHKIVKE